MSRKLSLPTELKPDLGKFTELNFIFTEIVLQNVNTFK